MLRIRPAQALAARQGVILLVVIALLTLFAVVGITFVIYAQAEASSMRVARQGETYTNPDADPEMLLNYFLSQLIYDTNNPFSSLRGWSMARNMYGMAGNTVPFNGSGRLSTAFPLNYAIRGPSTNPDNDGAPNPPYTYPDFNCMFLGAVRGDGSVMALSYARGSANNLRPPYSASLPSIGPPEDGFADVKNLPDSLGPRDVNPTTGNVTYTPNDSIWVDLGFPVMRSANGQRYKPLFAAFIQDLDGLVNVNAHGNLLGKIAGNTSSLSHQGWSTGEVNLGQVLLGGDSGNLFLGANGVPGRYDPSQWSSGTNMMLNYPYAPGGQFYCGTNIDAYEINLGTGLTLPQSGSSFSFPATAAPYSNGWWTRLDDTFNPALFNVLDPPHSYYWINAPGNFQQRTFPASDLEALYRYGDTGSPALTSDLFLLCPGSFMANNGRAMRLVTTHSFDLSAPGLMPNIAVAPNAQSQYQLPAPVNNTPGYPTSAPINFPAAPTNAGEFAGWYGVSQNHPGPLSQSLLKRIDLNRGFVDYPPVNNTGANVGQFQNTTNYAAALQSRRIMAQEIFDVLCSVTGAACQVNGLGQPVTVLADPLNQPKQYDALRWLAQLAVNIVDYVSFPQPQPNQTTPLGPDDVMTSFNWNTQATNNINNGWVFGTVLPRLVVNEAYVEIDNSPNDTGPQQTPPKAAQQSYDVNCWVELHNPFASDSGGGQVGAHPAISTPLQGTAQLYCPGGTYAAYRVILAQNATGGANQVKNMASNSNVLGLPKNIMTVVDKYDNDLTQINGKKFPTADAPNPNYQSATIPPNLLSGNSLYQVQPNYNGGAVQPSPVGGNQGFYVLGSSLAPFAGTPSNKGLKNAFATLSVKEEAPSQYATNDPLLKQNLSGSATQFTNNGNSLHYTYPLGPLNVGQLGHTVALQRLACPYMAPDPNPGTAGNPNPSFNPYVTVDYILNVPTQIGAISDTNGSPAAGYQKLASRNSVGRNQPYAADGSQLVSQLSSNKPYTSLSGGTSPQNTFFNPNAQGTAAFAYDWLMHANRPLVSPIELLQVSGYKPHQLTQMFMLGSTTIPPNTVATVQVFNPQPPTPANTGQPPANPGKFQHRAPWIGAVAAPGVLMPGMVQVPATLNQGAGTMIYRALEFFEAGIRPQMAPIGGRFPGKININTIWDPETWRALCDAQPLNFFYSPITGSGPPPLSQAVEDLYLGMYGTRTPATAPPGGPLTFQPGPTDLPFLSLAAPYAPTGTGTQYSILNTIASLPYGIQNTLLRPDPRGLMPNTKLPQNGLGPNGRADFNTNPLKLLLEPSIANKELSTAAANPSSTTPIGHPYLRMELLNKIFNSVTVRSNVFAVWLTVGFFEVTNDANSTVPPTLGLEINKLEGRNIRHRMFAIIDRTNLTIAGNPNPVLLQPANPNATLPIYQAQYLAGPRPFFINSLTPVTPPAPATALTAPVTVPITVPSTFGHYEDARWQIQNGVSLVIDSGPNQEIVTATNVQQGSPGSFTATFTKPHPVGFAISGAVLGQSGLPILGNPGPQPYFDVRNPTYSGVVRYFSIIE